MKGIGLTESKNYFGQPVEFKDDEGRRRFGTVVDPNKLEDVETEDLYGFHIVDDWHGANVQFLGSNFNEEDPAWYIVATADGKHPSDYHIVPSAQIKSYFLRQQLKDQDLGEFDSFVNTIL